MRIACASSLAHGRDYFAPLGDVVVLPEKDINAAAVREADAVITRSKVRLNAALLEDSRVSFVATATAGTDHLDIPWLEQHGIAWAAAPGCNANSVAEYIVAALLHLAVRHSVPLEGRTLAVVGVGHVGRRVAALAPRLGLRVLLNDPPRAAAEQRSDLQPLEDILPQADFVTLHTPLITDGPWPTERMVNARFLRLLKPGAVFLNASRGEVVDEDDLLFALRQGAVSRLVLDVFANEPRLRADLAAAATLCTPHIAGYSFEGRLNGTRLCYEAACRFFELDPPPPALDLPTLPVCEVDVRGLSDTEALERIVRQSYDIANDDAALRSGLAAEADARGRHFQSLRQHYAERYEFARHRLRLHDASEAVRATAAALGFALAT